MSESTEPTESAASPAAASNAGGASALRRAGNPFARALDAYDRLIGRATMYRLVLVALVAIAAAALVLSTLAVLLDDPNLFSIAPLAILASLAVSIAATVGATVGFARIAGRAASVESALITALILFALFRPTVEPLGLLILAAAGVIAAGSKFVLVWRGRHLVNPAALGALAVGLAGLSYPSWWIATPFLLPVVALGAIAVLRRTRRMSVALVFLAVAIGGSLPRYLQFYDLPTALSTLLVSGPLIFFAGFMLSEPLTLPPRRWQQWTVAALVGALYCLPYTQTLPWPNASVSTNALHTALLIGNLLAFAFFPRRRVALRLSGSRALTPTSREFAFEPLSPLRHAPGQYLELEVPHRGDSRGHRRAFSITSEPGAAELTIALRYSEPGSSFKRALADVAPGTVLDARWLGGDFVPPRAAAHPVLLVAGGIGVTPFLSHLRAESAADRRDTVLVYSVGDAADIPYAAELSDLDVPVLLIAPDAPAELPVGWTYLGPDRASGTALAGTVPRLAERIAYVSGSPAFVDSLRRELRGRVRGRIRTDHFSGY